MRKRDHLKVIKILERATKQAFKATMFNWTCLMNNAYQSKNPKPQIHWHFRPRYSHKVKFEKEVFDDKEFGHHYNRAKKKIVSESIQNKIIEIIKNNIK